MSGSLQGKRGKKSSTLRSQFQKLFHRSPSPQPTSTTPLTSQSSQQSTNEYAAIGGLPTTPPDPLTPSQRIKKQGNVAYRGLIEIVQALSECSDIFLPLKTACNVILTIDKTVDVRRSTYAVCEINSRILFLVHRECRRIENNSGNLKSS